MGYGSGCYWRIVIEVGRRGLEWDGVFSLDELEHVEERLEWSSRIG
jgi:hypothetical protein